jgi:hypothetical protein
MSDAAPLNRNSALDLLASVYGDRSDSDEDDAPNKLLQVSNDSNKLLSPTAESQLKCSSNGDFNGTKVSSSSKECQQGSFSQNSLLAQLYRGIRVWGGQPQGAASP